MNDESAHVRREDVHLYVHLDDMRLVLLPPRSSGAVTAILTIGGSFMPAQLSIDDTTGEASITWVDSHGDTDAAAPEGAEVTFSTDNPGVATVDAASGVIAPVAEGTANVVAEITGPGGGPLLEPDGVTPFSVQPAEIQVVAGAAVGAALEIKA